MSSQIFACVRIPRSQLHCHFDQKVRFTVLTTVKMQLAGTSYKVKLSKKKNGRD